MKRLQQLFSKPTPAPQIAMPPIAPEKPIWIIGDIHGRADLLDRLSEKIGAHPASPPNSHVVMVGDYIDRGENSAGVLAQLYAWSQETSDLTTLMGNHERMMLQFLEKPSRYGARWLHYGGLQTLASFGVGGFGETADASQLRRACDALRAALPNGMEAWLRRLPLQWQSGNVHVVHAAADPRMSMSHQAEKDLLWGHTDFASIPRQDGQWIAHGHTITDRPGLHDTGRIAVDTGAYYSGKLTAVLLTPDGQSEMLHT